MELTEASLKIIGSCFSPKNFDKLTVSQRVKQDLEYVKKVNEKFKELELAVIERTAPDCNENSSDWPQCRIKTRSSLANIISLTLPNAFIANSSDSEKLEILIEYLEEIRKDPSIIASLL
ncbi:MULTISPECIES: hypothetical protein [unclassified Microcoleus]|uniref:hypothetical protein n=1 Tax=unclassified Microcoleus TaxID=2642155 RepID=UPI002FCEFA2E